MRNFFSWIISIFATVLFLFPSYASSNDRCRSIQSLIEQSHKAILGEEYPWWYGVGQAKVESNCKWIASQDGYGSIGYFQLTPKFLDPIIRPLYPDYTKFNSPHHFYAAATYIKILWNESPSPVLWVIYQQYNGGYWVVKECKRAKSWTWEYCKRECRRSDVCVKLQGGKCFQHRSSCDINYEYSLKVFENGSLYRPDYVNEDQLLYSYW